MLLHRLSLVVERRGYSLVAVHAFLIALASLVVEQSLGTQASGVVACRLCGCGTWVVEHRLSSCGEWA